MISLLSHIQNLLIGTMCQLGQVNQRYNCHRHQVNLQHVIMVAAKSKWLQEIHRGH